PLARYWNVGWVAPRFRRIVRVPQVFAFDVGQQKHQAASSNRARRRGPNATRQMFHAVVIVVNRETNLTQVVRALRTSSGLARGLYGRHQKTDEDANDGDYDQQLDQRESRMLARHDEFPF